VEHTLHSFARRNNRGKVLNISDLILDLAARMAITLRHFGDVEADNALCSSFDEHLDDATADHAVALPSLAKKNKQSETGSVGADDEESG
jgi:hypothetical protein